MLHWTIASLFLCFSSLAVAADPGPAPIQSKPQLPVFQPQPPVPPVADAAGPQGQAAAPELPEFDPLPLPTPPAQKPQQPLQVDWGDLSLFFYISNPKMERRATTDVLGNASVDTYFSFDVSSRKNFSNVTIFAGKFYDANRYEVFSMPLEFKPSPYKWTRGTRARAYLMMPDDLEKVRSLVFGTMF